MGTGATTFRREKAFPCLAVVVVALCAALVGQPVPAQAARPAHGARLKAHYRQHRLAIDFARIAFRRTRASGQSSSPGPVSPRFFGVNAGRLFYPPEDAWDARLSTLASTGVKVVRTDIGWDSVESKPPVDGVHTYNWRRLDATVAALARHGLEWLPIIDYSAPWAESDREGRPGFAPPSDPAVFAEFARAVASRYGRGGSFWSENPGLPALPVSEYEVWNEENSDLFFHGADPGRYASLYAQTRAAIKTVDPAATVMVGGLVANPDTVTWLDSFIAALPAHGEEIDAIGWHPYFTNVDQVWQALRELRQDLESHGLNPPIDLTEVNSPEVAGSPGLLEQLALNLPGSGCGVSGMVVFSWMQPPAADGGQNYAITDADGNLNAAGLAYSSAVQATSGAPARSSSLCTDDAEDAHASRRVFHRAGSIGLSQAVEVAP